jgi:hypothetical protein
MTTTVLPAPKEVRELLEGLVGRPVTVAPGDPVTPSEKRAAALAVYVDPQLATNAVCVMDLGAAGYTAGALALLPPGGVQDAVEEDRELSDLHVEALHEVVNVVAALFNTPGAPHSKLYRLYAPGEALPADLAQLAAGYHRLDLAVEVGGYGKGALSIVLPA